ncbi:hypothetical protein C0J08_11215 [Marinomonas sp. CT5]|nr:hypothetical protein [Oceanospirillaceae bacterium]QUX98144.1 hypothetical protein C0J08_11215 [Marinomonas sp. CT5]
MQICYLLVSLCFSSLIFAECRDFDAKQAADKAAQNLTGGKTFKRALILKKHLPSRRKEVASYIHVKETSLYYTIFFLVNDSCNAQFIKRTNGKH